MTAGADTARPVLVTTPAGTVGREVVGALLDRGLTVRAGVRAPRADRQRLPADVEVVRLDLADPSTYADAVDGAGAMFLLRPPSIARVVGTLNRLVDVAEQAGVEHCVFLSVAGADRQRMIPHAQVERRLTGSSMTWTFLRPTHFAQNFTGPYRPDLADGRLVLPAGAGRVAFVDVRDLADVAALSFADPPAHAGRAYHLTGPEPFGFGDITAMLSRASGRTILYEPSSVPRFVRHQWSRGTRPSTIGLLTMLHVSLRRGSAAAVDDTLPRLLGRPARTMAAFVGENAAVWGP